jgi:hypothetical protein
MCYSNHMSKIKTPYGLDRYRRSYRKGEFRYPQGTKPEAVILDIDGTWLDWGNKVNPTTLAWVEKHHAAGRTIIVITARTHEWEYESSWDMLAHTMPCAFVGPICRSETDPRYAPEFKREAMEAMSAIYHIVGAADDSRYVNTMLEWWANEYFENPDDFDHLKTSYSEYKDWRKDLPSKAYRKTSVVIPDAPYKPYWGSTAVGGSKHRAAGTRNYQGDPEYVPWWDQEAQKGSETVSLDMDEIYDFVDERRG